MEAILDLAAILDLRKWAKSRYYLSQWISTDIKSEKQKEKGKLIIVLVAYTVLYKWRPFWIWQPSWILGNEPNDVLKWILI